MKLIAKVIIQIISNLVAIYAAVNLVSGVSFSGGFEDLLIAAGILSLINIFIRPILKLIFGPIIVITLGLFILVINVLSIKILDIVSDPLTIQGYMPLFLASLIVGIVNFIVTASGKAVYKE